jgi:hypothetical protein
MSPSSGPQPTSGASTQYGRPSTSAKAKARYQQDPPAPRRKAKKKSSADPDNDALDNDDNDNDTEVVVEARVALLEWKVKSPAWYGVLKCLVQAQHTQEWEVTFVHITRHTTQELLSIAQQMYGKQNALPTDEGELRTNHLLELLSKFHL